MAGFLVIGLGYLLVVLVHGAFYLRLNRNILRVVPFNLASALLVLAAGAFGISGDHENPASARATTRSRSRSSSRRCSAWRGRPRCGGRTPTSPCSSAS
jgi:hypothetical protein